MDTTAASNELLTPKAGPTPVTPPRYDQGIVLYDGTCAFCRASVGLISRLDWLDRLSFQDATDRASWPKTTVSLEMTQLMDQMHLITPDRARSFAGFRAFRWMAGRLPLLWPVVPFMYIPGVPQLGQRVYMLIAKYRYNLVPCIDGVCSIPINKNKSKAKKPEKPAATTTDA